MILIPQVYLRGGKLVTLEGTRSTVFREDPFETARMLKDAGAEGILCMDLSVTPVGASPNFSAIKKIHDELEIGIYVGGNFKTPEEIEIYIKGGMELVILGTIAYQKPDFLENACKRFPGKIAAHIDVRGGRVTIPGYAVATNKTPFDYVEAFVKHGIRYILYSDINADGSLTDKNVASTEAFCNNVTARIICTSDVSNLSDIEKIARCQAPRLEGLVLSKSLYESRIDLRGAIAMVNDIALSNESDTTLTEM